MTEKKIEYAIEGNATGYVAALEQAAKATAIGADNIKKEFGRIGEAFGKVQGALLAISAIVAGGAFFKDAIQASVKMAGEVGNLSKRMSISTAEASALNTALGDIGSDSDTYIGAFDKFAKQLHSNEAGLQAMGLQTRDANGNLRDSNTLFTEAVAVVGDHKLGLDQTTAAQTLFGKGVEDVIKLQKLSNAVLDEAKAKNEELGLTITQQNIEAAKRYKAAMNDVDDVFTAITKTVGDAVMPVFTEMATYFSSTGPSVVGVFKGALTGLLLVFRAVQMSVKTVAYAFFEMVSALADGAEILGTVFNKLLEGDISGAEASAKKIGERLGMAFGENYKNATEKTLVDAQSLFSEDVNRMYGEKTASTAKPKGGSRNMDFEKTKGGGADKTRIGQWDAELEERKLNLAEQARAEGTFREMSKAEELAYWEGIQSTQKLNDAETLALRKKTASLGLEINKGEFDARIEALKADREALEKDYAGREQIAQQAYQETVARFGAESKEAQKALAEVAAEHRKLLEQQRALEMAATEARRARQAADLDLAHVAYQEAAALGLLSHAEMLQAEAAFEQQRYQLRAQALQERLALVDPVRDPVAFDAASRQIEDAERAHQLRLAQIRSQQNIAAQADVTRTLGNIENAWAGVIQKAMQGQLTLAGIIKGLFQGVAQAVLSTLSQIAAKWLINLAAQKLLGKATALGDISASAGRAGAAAVASTAAIPIIGPAMAPAAGAMAMAQALSFMPLASASGGYDIPAGINPLVQAHAREMILPAKHADVIRALAESQQAGGATAATAAPVVLKGASAGEFFIANRRELAAALGVSHRNFGLRST